MKSMTSADAQNKFGQVIEAAQRQPIAITKHGRPAVVVMSVEDYERYWGEAWTKLRKTAQRASDHAEQQGLTQEKLNALLADES